MNYSTLIRDLIKPITKKNPCGHFLRYEEVYTLIQTARHEEEDNLPRGVWKRELKGASWKSVEDIAVTSLKSKTKDLQIAAWLTEAWLELRGLEGFSQGLELILKLIETFWNKLYPPLEEDAEFRLSPITWINEKLTQRLQNLALTTPYESKIKPVYLYDWIKVQKQPHADLKSKIETGIEKTQRDFFETLQSQAQHTLVVINALHTALIKKESGAEGSLYKLRETLETILHFVTYALERLPAENPSIASEAIQSKPSIPETSSFKASPSNQFSQPEVTMSKSSSKTVPFTPPSFENREQAYELLEKIASYLEKREPHSPTPYLIRRAVSWGHMSLADLIKEFSMDPSGLNQLTRLLGLDQNKAQPSAQSQLSSSPPVSQIPNG